MADYPEAAQSKAAVFARRLGSASLLYLVLLAGLFVQDASIARAAFGGVITLLGVLGLIEYFDMAIKAGLSTRPQKFTGVLLGAIFIMAVFWALAIRENDEIALHIQLLGVLAIVPLIGFRQVFAPDGASKISGMAVATFGVVYVALLLNLLQFIRYHGDAGHWWLLYFIVVTKMSDTGAYCVGSLIGKTKMIPKVSPGKTWEGFAGGIVFSVLASWGFLHFAGQHFAGFQLSHAIVLAIILGVGSVVGDLVESLMKREADVKDSGKFLPGVGGALDLLDSLLFNAPIMYLYLRFVL